MVVVEHGGVEGMMVRDLGFFEELRGKKMELAMEAFWRVFLTLTMMATSWL